MMRLPNGCVNARRSLRRGNGLAGETHQGPLINASALAKVERHVVDAAATGARLLTGGSASIRQGHFSRRPC